MMGYLIKIKLTGMGKIKDYFKLTNLGFSFI
jgi:hypothetical protein